MPPYRFHIQHSVESNHTVNPCRGKLHHLGYVVDRLGTQIAELFLGQIEDREHRSLFFRIAVDYLREFFKRFLGKL